MRRVTLVLVAVACLCANAVASDEKPFDFRSVRWGMSQGEVKHSEEGDPVFDYPDLGILTYSDYLFSRKVQLMYRFDSNGSLYSTIYSLRKVDNINITEAQIKTYYSDLVEALAEKYNAPKQGQVLGAGNLETPEWNYGDTQIIIRLNDDTEPVTLTYYSKELRAKRRELVKLESKKKL